MLPKAEPSSSRKPLSNEVVELACALEVLRIPRTLRIEGELPNLEVGGSIDVGVAEPVAARLVLEAFDDDWCQSNDLRVFGRDLDGVWRLFSPSTEARACDAVKVAVQLPGHGAHRTV